MREWRYSGTTQNEVSEREQRNGRLAQEIAAEGIVLLKNEDLLPLSPADPIALLGKGADRTIKGGIGSGDVNNRENISIYAGLQKLGVNLTSTDWLENYEERYRKARMDWKETVLNEVKKGGNPFDAYSRNPFSLPDGKYVSEADLQGAKAAVYVISRIAGEGKDRRRVEGDYYLSKKEQEDLKFLNAQKMPIVLIVNAGGPVELTEVLENLEMIKAVLNISQLGQAGGLAVADVLFGKKTPGGHLTTTWARHYEDYPAAEKFGYLNGDLESEEYTEGIFVGYRYFDSFRIKPLFPFGFGLSYTSFEQEAVCTELLGSRVQLQVKVKNTGAEYAGKEVVQVYVTLPQNGLEKEYQRLVGFAKTALLQPGEEQTLTIAFDCAHLASFSEEKNAWVTEAGEYGVWFGNNSADTELAAVLTLSESAVTEYVKTEKTENAFEEFHNTEALKERYLEWTQEAQKKGVVRICLDESIQKISEDAKARREQSALKEEEALEKLVKEIPTEKLIPLLCGNISENLSNLGAAGISVPGSAGETAGALEAEYQIPPVVMADGPAGVRLRQHYEVNRENGEIYGVGVLGAMENGILEEHVRHENADEYYQYCTAFPVGTALAQTWDPDLIRSFGEAVAEEMKEFHVGLWLAPGMNIHRNPLGGRNFEYYSEDPLVSGLVAAAVTDGVQSQEGCGVTIKHYAANNQEDNRMGVNAHISHRALREIYLKGFEIAVRTSAPASIMTSYNLINGIHTANSRNLCTTIAREEWGFDGAIMTDWCTTFPEGGSTPWKCVAAGNDIMMPGCPQDKENVLDAYRQGLLSEKDIRLCAARVIKMVNRLTGKTV